MKLNWTNLTRGERTEYMGLQMSPTRGRYSSYLPEGCSECAYCGHAHQGFMGLCPDCFARWEQLRNRLEKEVVA